MTRREFITDMLRNLYDLQEKVLLLENFPCTCGITLRQREDHFRVDLYIYPVQRNTSKTFVFESDMAVNDMQVEYIKAINFLNDATGGRIQW